jgi:hypothetical protein
MEEILPGEGCTIATARHGANDVEMIIGRVSDGKWQACVRLSRDGMELYENRSPRVDTSDDVMELANGMMGLVADQFGLEWSIAGIDPGEIQ